MSIKLLQIALLSIALTACSGSGGGKSSPNTPNNPNTGGDSGGDTGDTGPIKEISTIKMIVSKQVANITPATVNILPIDDTQTLPTNNTALVASGVGAHSVDNLLVSDDTYLHESLSLVVNNVSSDPVEYNDGVDSITLALSAIQSSFEEFSPNVEYAENKLAPLYNIKNEVFFNNDGESSSFNKLVEYKGDYYFASQYGVDFKRAIYRLTSEGVIERVVDDVSFAGVTLHDGELYFSKTKSAGIIKLYKTDGISVTQVSDILGASSDNIGTMHSGVDGNLYFAANDSTARSKLYKLSSTEIRKISSINAGNADAPAYVTTLGSMTYFQMFVSGARTKLFKTDGTTLSQVSDTSSAGGDSSFEHTAVYNGEIYFTASNATGRQKLFKTDGTLVKEVSNTNPASNDSPKNLFSTPDGIYFSAFTSNDARKLHLLNESGISVISNTSENLSTNDSSGKMVILGDHYYFISTDSNDARKLYKMKEGVITKVLDINLGIDDFDDDESLVVHRGAIYTPIKVSEDNTKMARIDEEGVSIVSDTNQGGSDNVSIAHPAGNYILYTSKYGATNSIVKVSLPVP